MSPILRRFERACNRLAAKRCRDAGQTVTEIALSAKRSQTTIRRWLREI